MKRISAICTVSLALLLLTFFIFLFLAVRPDPDDMIISLDVRGHSLYYALKMRYLLSSFRTSLIFSEASVLGGNEHSAFPAKMFIYFFLTFLAFVIVIYHLIKKVFALAAGDWKEKLFLFCISLVIAGSGYFLCSSRIEIYGWLGAAGSHWLPMVCVLYSILVLLRSGSSFFIDAFLLAICSLLIAGGAEHINLLVILMNIYFLYRVFRRKRFSIAKKKLLFFSVFHFLCCVLIFTNPGIWLRVQDVNAAQASEYDPGNFFVMFFQPYKLVGVALAFFAAFGLKQYFKISISPSVLSVKTVLGVGLMVFCVCFIMGLAAYHSYNIGRLWLPFDLFLLTCFVLIGLRMEASPLVNASLGLILVLLMAGYIYRHVPALNEFRKGYDSVVKQVVNAEADKIVVADFPEPDLVNLVELDADPNNELNTLFCRFYGSTAKISVQHNYSKSR